MLSTYGIMLLKFNLITFLFQPLCIFNTHFTLHFKHFDYILLVRLAWFCRSHSGRENTRRYVELFFVFLDNWPEGSISFMNRDGWGTSLKSFVISPTTWVPGMFLPLHWVSDEVLETCVLLQRFAWCSCSLWELEHIHQASHVKGRSLQQWCDGNLNRRGPAPSLQSIVLGWLQLQPMSGLAGLLQGRSWKWLRVSWKSWEFLDT